MVEVLLRIAAFLGVVGLFFGGPLLYLVRVSSGIGALLVAFLILFPFGYYFLYMMMYTLRTRGGALVELRSGSGAGEGEGLSVTASHAKPGELGTLEIDLYADRSAERRIRFNAWRRGFFYSLIPLLLLLLLFHFFPELHVMNELRSVVPNMATAVAVTGDAMQLIIRATRPADLPLYDAWRYEVAILDVRGMFDRADLVLTTMNLRFDSCPPDDVGRSDLAKYKVVFVNCPGHLPLSATKKLRQAVEDGAWLFTTDWALDETLGRVTPGYVQPTGVKTGDTAYPITRADPASPFTRDLMPRNSAPAWWVFFSYPIQVLKADEVKTFLEADRLGADYGSKSIAVTYPFGKGRVVHIIGHFYEQKCFSDGSGTAYDFVTGDLGVAAAGVSPEFKTALQAVPRGRFELAYSVMRLMANVLIERRREATPAPGPPPANPR